MRLAALVLGALAVATGLLAIATAPTSWAVGEETQLNTRGEEGVSPISDGTYVLFGQGTRSLDSGERGCRRDTWCQVAAYVAYSIVTGERRLLYAPEPNGLDVPETPRLFGNGTLVVRAPARLVDVPTGAIARLPWDDSFEPTARWDQTIAGFRTRPGEAALLQVVNLSNPSQFMTVPREAPAGTNREVVIAIASEYLFVSSHFPPDTLRLEVIDMKTGVSTNVSAPGRPFLWTLDPMAVAISDGQFLLPTLREGAVHILIVNAKDGTIAEDRVVELPCRCSIHMLSSNGPHWVASFAGEGRGGFIRGTGGAVTQVELAPGSMHKVAGPEGIVFERGNDVLFAKRGPPLRTVMFGGAAGTLAVLSVGLILVARSTRSSQRGVCDSCGATLRDGTSFCEACGHVRT